MKQTIRKNYYEILDVRPDSSPDEIEKSYREALSIYGSGSAATYSLYTEEEKRALLGQLNEAYETLRDPVKKSAYDSSIGSMTYEEEPSEFDIKDLRSSMGAGEETHVKRPAIEARNVVKIEHPFSMTENPDQMVVEQYRILYTKIEEMRTGKGYTSFAVTSSVKSEGKSVTSLSLAYLMASDFKKRTILIEGDLRKSSTVKGYLNGARDLGLSDVLTGKCDLHSALARVEGTSLYILHSGSYAKKPSELIGSAAMRSLMNTLKSEFDYIILDSPPVLPLVDVNILSKLVDGVLFVVRAGKTSRSLVTMALDSISSANVLGIVLNGAETKLKKYYY